jgi:hypothetical protein
VLNGTSVLPACVVVDGRSVTARPNAGEIAQRANS